MSDFNEVVRLAVDTYHGKPVKYSMDESLDVLRQALIEANGGSTILDYKAIRDGKCTGLFSLIETILSRTAKEGFQGDEYFNNMVEYRNVALGDKNLFEVEDNYLFSVSEAADGTQAIRRQRLGGVSVTSIPTSMKYIKLYDELERIMAGQVDLNKFISKVSESFRQKRLNDIHGLWNRATADDFGGDTFFPAAGNFNEDVLLDLIAHVEASAGGKLATIVGTSKALRKVNPSIKGDAYNNDMYNLGYCGKFYGRSVVGTPQRHKVGTKEFALNDNTISVVAGDDKPIKFVDEGQPTIILGNPTANKDLTQDYLYAEKYGLGLLLAGGNAGIGRYELTD